MMGGSRAKARRSVWDVIYCPLGAASYGGAERSLLELAAAIQGRGWSVLIVAERALVDTEFPEVAARYGLAVEWVDWAPKRGAWANFRTALRFFRGLETRILHFNISWREHMWAVALAARVARIPVLIGTMRAMPDPHTLIPRKRYLGVFPGLQLWHWSEVAVGWLWGRLLKRTVSINARDFPVRLVRDFHYPRDRLTVIYNGIRISDARMSDSSRESDRERFGVAPEEFLICYVGRVSPEKGIHVLIRAVHELKGPVRLLIVGDGAQKQALEELVDSLNEQNRVSFLGYRKEPKDVMASADVVVIPSLWYEAFGRTVVEAMSVSVPVVASDIGGMAELFTHGVHGLYVQPDSVEALASALTKLQADPDARKQMGVAARQWAVERYSSDRVYEEYFQLYNSLAFNG